jgi:fatty acid synthase
LLGHTDSALVCGTFMSFEPFLHQISQETGVCSPRGVSNVLDEEADGYVKSETVGAVFIQRARTARRVYARIVGARMGADGNKKSGAFHPSSEAQQQLMTMTYREANVDPLRITYFEAHATGTKVSYY